MEALVDLPLLIEPLEQSPHHPSQCEQRVWGEIHLPDHDDIGPNFIDRYAPNITLPVERNETRKSMPVPADRLRLDAIGSQRHQEALNRILQRQRSASHHKRAHTRRLSIGPPRPSSHSLGGSHLDHLIPAAPDYPHVGFGPAPLGRPRPLAWAPPKGAWPSTLVVRLGRTGDPHLIPPWRSHDWLTSETRTIHVEIAVLDRVLHHVTNALAWIPQEICPRETGPFAPARMDERKVNRPIHEHMKMRHTTTLVFQRRRVREIRLTDESPISPPKH